ncbi:MAG: ABC transporter substrate-binding protein [Pseudomonadales bacterium]|jgi:peptide/nickel transport system substrate-binding protein|nr:ABC transporter substrate-binding protein [Pseudomonadales bacterium]
MHRALPPTRRPRGRRGTRPLVLAGLLLLAGCAPGGDPEHLAIAGPFEFTSQEPARDGYVYTRLQVAETLVDVAEDGRLVPGLATAWSTAADGLRWRFRLRAGVRFHDGALLDAAAAAGALERARSRSVFLREAPIAEIAAEGADVVRIDLTRPFALLPAALTHYSTLVASPGSYRADGYVAQLHGTGPYRIAEIDPPHRLVVERFPGWRGPAPAIDRVSYLTGHRAESRTLQVLSGQTDLVYTLDPASLDPLRRSPGVEVHERLIPRTLQLKVNAGHPFLVDVRARRALSLALDRRGLAERVLATPGVEAGQLLPPLFEAWHLPELAPPARDLDRARALLAALGWAPGPDGVLRRDGEPFALSLMTYADRPELVVLATAIQAQLRELGVAVAVSVENSGSIPLGHATGTLELALMARNYGTVGDPLGTVLADFGGDGGGDWGAMNWDNGAIRADLAALQVETAPARRRAHAQRIARVLHDELPVIPVLYYVQHTAVAERVRGFTFDPFERSYRVAAMELAGP